MCEQLDPERFYGETATILGLQQNPKSDMCQNRERDTSEEQEKDRISSCTRTVSKQKKTTIMEMER
jgi:hypothetical protein